MSSATDCQKRQWIAESEQTFSLMREGAWGRVRSERGAAERRNRDSFRLLAYNDLKRRNHC